MFKTTKRLGRKKLKMNELIDKYFKGTLNADEQMLFENYLNEHADFKAEYEFQIQVRKAIHIKERADLKSMLQNIEAKQAISNLKVVKRSFWPFAAAAVLLMVAGFGIYQYFNNSVDSQKLYAANFQAFPNVIAPIVRGENYNSIQSDAFKAYDANDFEAAVMLFEKLEQKNYVQFYRGICYLELQNPNKTIELFENKTFENDPYPLETYRKWYLALAYLKIDNIDKALPLLKKLTTNDNAQKLKALELIEQLGEQ